LSYKPTNQTEKWYGRHERRDNKTNAEAGIKNTRIRAGPNNRDYWQTDRGQDNANALPNTEGVGNISQARSNNKTFGRDIATTESHIADRAEPKFGNRRQVRYKATNPQFITARSNGMSRLNIEKLYPEGSGRIKPNL
jgi:hypothetical protein